MATMAEFVLDARTFRIGRAFGALPGVEVELERVVPLRNAIVPYAWIRGVTADEVRRVLLERDAVRTVRVIDSLPEQGTLLHVEWDRAVEDALTSLADLDLELLSGVGTAREWRLAFRAERRADVTSFQQFCTERDIDADLVRLTDVGGNGPTQVSHLTPEQYETLVLAYEQGYFDEPRRATLQDLADLLGVSRQSVGGRLRRGYRNLVGGTLVQARDRPGGD